MSLSPAPNPTGSSLVLESTTVDMELSSSLVTVRGVPFPNCWQVGVAMHMDHPLSVSESSVRLWGLYTFLSGVLERTRHFRSVQVPGTSPALEWSREPG